jgi:FMN reductase
VRAADVLVIATRGYHSGISGLVKNALDTLEELRDDERPYLDGRASETSLALPRICQIGLR